MHCAPEADGVIVSELDSVDALRFAVAVTLVGVVEESRKVIVIGVSAAGVLGVTVNLPSDVTGVAIGNNEALLEAAV